MKVGIIGACYGRHLTRHTICTDGSCFCFKGSNKPSILLSLLECPIAEKILLWKPVFWSKKISLFDLTQLKWRALCENVHSKSNYSLLKNSPLHSICTKRKQSKPFQFNTYVYCVIQAFMIWWITARFATFFCLLLIKYYYLSWRK